MGLKSQWLAVIALFLCQLWDVHCDSLPVKTFYAANESQPSELTIGKPGTSGTFTFLDPGVVQYRLIKIEGESVVIGGSVPSMVITTERLHLASTNITLTQGMRLIVSKLFALSSSRVTLLDGAMLAISSGANASIVRSVLIDGQAYGAGFVNEGFVEVTTEVSLYFQTNFFNFGSVVLHDFAGVTIAQTGMHLGTILVCHTCKLDFRLPSQSVLFVLEEGSKVEGDGQITVTCGVLLAAGWISATQVIVGAAEVASAAPIAILQTRYPLVADVVIGPGGQLLGDMHGTSGTITQFDLDINPQGTLAIYNVGHPISHPLNVEKDVQLDGSIAVAMAGDLQLGLIASDFPLLQYGSTSNGELPPLENLTCWPTSTADKYLRRGNRTLHLQLVPEIAYSPLVKVILNYTASMDWDMWSSILAAQMGITQAQVFQASTQERSTDPTGIQLQFIAGSDAEAWDVAAAFLALVNSNPELAKQLGIAAAFWVTQRPRSMISEESNTPVLIALICLAVACVITLCCILFCWWRVVHTYHKEAVRKRRLKQDEANAPPAANKLLFGGQPQGHHGIGKPPRHRIKDDFFTSAASVLREDSEPFDLLSPRGQQRCEADSCMSASAFAFDRVNKSQPGTMKPSNMVLRDYPWVEEESNTTAFYLSGLDQTSQCSHWQAGGPEYEAHHMADTMSQHHFTATDPPQPMSPMPYRTLSHRSANYVFSHSSPQTPLSHGTRTPTRWTPSSFRNPSTLQMHNQPEAAIDYESRWADGDLLGLDDIASNDSDDSCTLSHAQVVVQVPPEPPSDTVASSGIRSLTSTRALLDSNARFLNMLDVHRSLTVTQRPSSITSTVHRTSRHVRTTTPVDWAMSGMAFVGTSQPELYPDESGFGLDLEDIHPVVGSRMSASPPQAGGHPSQASANMPFTARPPISGRSDSPSFFESVHGSIPSQYYPGSVAQGAVNSPMMPPAGWLTPSASQSAHHISQDVFSRMGYNPPADPVVPPRSQMPVGLKGSSVGNSFIQRHSSSQRLGAQFK